MQGDKISEMRGKVTSQRILPGGDFRYVQMEVNIQEQGPVFGADVTEMGTYTVLERVGGQLYGEGQGIWMTADGDSAIWKGHGVGKPTGSGMGMSFRYSAAFQAAADGKLARLNNVLVIGEHEVDAEGNTHTTCWEWK
jgi:hypothetical protein